MFNEFGEPMVATTLIVFKMGISTGNLYYHYHSEGSDRGAPLRPHRGG